MEAKARQIDSWRKSRGPSGGGGAFLAACKQTRTTRLPFEVAATGD